jgi:methylaspartate ammonia-lyase
MNRYSELLISKRINAEILPKAIEYMRLYQMSKEGNAYNPTMHLDTYYGSELKDELFRPIKKLLMFVQNKYDSIIDSIYYDNFVDMGDGEKQALITTINNIGEYLTLISKCSEVLEKASEHADVYIETEGYIPNERLFRGDAYNSLY